MAAELGLAAKHFSELIKEQERLTEIAKGEIPGIISIFYTLEAIKKLKNEKKEAENKAKEKPHNGGAVALAAYAAAAYRDAKYCLMGRKFLRCAGLNGKERATFGRMLLTNQAQLAADQ